MTRWALGLVLAAWLVFGATWGALHWLIMPRIGDFRPLLEARASQWLGLPVHIGTMATTSNGMMPSIELTHVTLIGPNGQAALVLPRVLVAVSPRSLWHLGFEQIYIDRPQLDIRRTADGRITVAGIDLSGDKTGKTGKTDETVAADWLFAQPELAIQNGTVRWTDDQRLLDPVILQSVHAVVRNRGRHHDLRIDATPPPQWGDAVSLRGQFLQPLLSHRNGRWREWDGQIYAASERVDVSGLRRYADLGVDLTQGEGALRAWVDIRQGRAVQAVADVSLAQVSLTLRADLQPVTLRQVQGRLGLRLLDPGIEVVARALTFETQDGLLWPAGHLRMTLTGDAGHVTEQGTLEADQIDVAALAQLADRVPINDADRARWIAHAPKGRIDRLTASWQGPVTAPHRYTLKGQASQIDVTAVASVPGVQGLNVHFELDQSAGQASLSMKDGSVTLPEIFENPTITVDQMSARAKWQVQGEHLAVQLEQLKFANADAAGEAWIKWHTDDVGTSPSHARYPGVLDLQASLSRADGRAVHRYLPLVIDKAARDYVRDAVLGGQSSAVQFRVKGDIDQLPLIDPRKGIFKITAQVTDATLAFVPRSLQASTDLPWPVLTDLAGDLEIDRMQLQVKNAHARLGDTGAVQATGIDVVINDVTHPRVVVTAALSGALPDLLRTVNTAPPGAMMGDALSRSTGTGMVEGKFTLTLPIANLARSTLNGSIALKGNDVRITPESPPLSQVRGSVLFSEAALSLGNVQARMLGGDVRLDGGLVFVADSPRVRNAPTEIRATGTASADGLAQTPELGLLAHLARKATGSAAYSATLGLRGGVQELQVTTHLQGLALQLPPPLSKAADTLLPVRYATTSITGASGSQQDRLTLSIADLVRVVYERDMSQKQPRVLRGAIGFGLDASESVDLPAQGVNANIKVGQFNVDAWNDVWTQASAAGTTLGASAAPPVDASALASYLPTALALRADGLVYGDRQFNHLTVGATRYGQVWSINLVASEINGRLDYRPPGDAGAGGLVHARLARLSLAPSVARDVETLLDTRPANIPDLDIVVEDFELRGKPLGRLEVVAVNRQRPSTGGSGTGTGTSVDAGVREWRLNTLNLITPEATFAANGSWAAAPAAQGASERRRTVMDFELNISDSGALLARLGMKDVIRGGQGKLQGRVTWQGSPLDPDYPSMGGAFTVHVESGQFLKADPGLAKLLGVLSLQSLPRRLALDFRDVFSDGFAFDFLRGDVSIDRGIANTHNLQMKGVNAAVMMEGQADIAREIQDIRVVVIPEINAGTASLLASIMNPVVGLGTFVAQYILRRPLMETATQEFHIDGSWSDPKVTKITTAALPSSSPASSAAPRP